MDVESLLRKIEGDVTISAGYRQELEAAVQWMILHQFDQLVHLLYRIDVDERRLKDALAADREGNSAALITDLIIRRAQQKAAARATFPKRDIPPEEAW